ncbi:hypothetical protein DPMN_049952 [Dreissena polymorpha]|uniref:Uncharacterized protein n=1 Tax=Dreissena polymorpha TaxID=45954 RepID=A0A9D4CFU5_DREPO|nr:hypothetical protein DPMN_049952 [Dreissena polymorpha]
MACMRLHNLCVSRNVSLLEAIEVEAGDHNLPVPIAENRDGQNRKRDLLRLFE